MQRKRRRVYGEHRSSIQAIDRNDHGNYGKYLNSPEWFKIRARVLRVRRTCELCGKEAEQVHHDNYDSVVMAGAMDDCLVSLCCECHHEIEFDGDEKLPFNCVQGKLRRLLKEREKGDALKRINKASNLVRNLNRALENRPSKIRAGCKGGTGFAKLAKKRVKASRAEIQSIRAKVKRGEL
jgi:hypothetical protein